MTGKHEPELYKITVTPEEPLSVVRHDPKLEFVDEDCDRDSSFSEDLDFVQPTVIWSEPTVETYEGEDVPKVASWTARYDPSEIYDRDQSCEILSDSRKPRRSVNIDEKLEIIRRHEAGEGANSIARAVGLAQSTVSTIIKNACIIKTAGEFMKPGASNRIAKSRDIVMAKMERILKMWIEDHIRRNVPLSTSSIMSKARSLWEAVRNEMNPEALKGTADVFKASSGWFERFKRRANLCNLSFHGKAAARIVAEPTAVKDLQSALQERIARGGYTPRQVLNIDQTGLCWKNLQTHTDISREDSMSNVKLNDDPLTLMLGSNAEGNFKLKPLLVYHWENPRSINGVDKDNLPVIWRSSPNARLTASLCHSYIVDYLSKACEEYSKANNIPNKFLLLIDYSPTNPADMVTWASNIEVMFLPPNAKHPMGQDVMSTFIAYYFRCTMEQLIQETDGENMPTIEEFWKSYSIRKAIENIAAAWAEVKQSKLNEAWNAVWPECVYEFFGFNEEERVKRYSLDLSQESGFSEAEEDEDEYFFSDSEPSKEEPVSVTKENLGDPSKEEPVSVTKENLGDPSKEKPLNISKENLGEEKNKDFYAPSNSSIVKQLRQIRIDKRGTGQKNGEVPGVPLKSLSTTQLRCFLTAVSDALAVVVGSDEDSARSFGVKSKVNEAIKCYQELYDNKIDEIKKAVTASTFQPISAVNGLQPFSSKAKPTPQSNEARTSVPNTSASSVCHYASQQKSCSVFSKKPAATANLDCGSNVVNEDAANTSQRNGRPVRKRKGTFITGPDFINSDEDADIVSAARRCFCCYNKKPQDMEARKNATAGHTESFKKARVSKKSPGRSDCFVQTVEKVCRSPRSEVNPHNISHQHNRPMVCVDRAEVNSYLNIRQLERPLVFVDRAEVNVHSKNQQYIRPVVFVDRTEVNTCSNTRPFDRPMVCVDRAEVRKWCSTVNVEKPSRAEVKSQDQKGRESGKSDVIKEEWELLEANKVKQEPDTFTVENCENISICDVQVKQEPDENVTLVKEEYEMDSTDFGQLNHI